MKLALFLSLLALSVSSSAAQDSPAYSSCTSKAKTQTELNVCASEEASRADAESDAAFHALLSKAAADSEALEKIQIAESAWRAYREAFVDAMYPAKDKQAAYGSIYPMKVDLLRAEFAREHLAALKKLSQQY